MLEHILNGGIIMIPLLTLSVIEVAVILDRMAVFKQAEKDATALRRDVMQRVQNSELEEAISACGAFGGPVAALLSAGLTKFLNLATRGGMTLDEIKDDVNETLTDYAPHVIDLLEERLNLLTMIAGVSPLLGMTGTVTGMIRSFSSLAKSGMAADAVGTGISEALVTTAAGLIIAIPAVVAYNIFTRKIDRFTLEMEESATELMEVIKVTFHEDSE